MAATISSLSKLSPAGIVWRPQGALLDGPEGPMALLDGSEGPMPKKARSKSPSTVSVLLLADTVTPLTLVSGTVHLCAPTPPCRAPPSGRCNIVLPEHRST